MQWKRRAVSGALIFSVLGLFAGGALAQGYPNKPITFIAPFPAGSAAELLGRIIGRKLHESWGQPVVVDAKPGAGGTIGAEYVVKSAPDGYTMLVGSSAETTVGVSLYKKISYHTLRDLAPVIAIGPMPNMLVANPAAGIGSIKELVTLAKSQPGKLNFASSGNGTTSHLGMEMLKLQAGIDMIHVPHRGSQPAITDTLGGRTDIMWGPMATLLPHVNAGKLRALAVSTDKRSAAAPDVPTLKESGYSDFEASLWWGILAPAATPKDIVAKLNAEIGRIMQMPDVRASLVKLGVEPLGGSSEQYAALLKSEIAKWANVIKESGARVE
jgi:tripartite-type tricarboxylate transporter receptor subunit TctC